jgi:hypothetical protein
MFVIERAGARKTKCRLVTTTVLKKADFRKIARAMAVKPLMARKVGYIAARKAKRREKIETYWNGKETTNMARAGDWVVTSLTPAKRLLRDKRRNTNTYVVKAKTFAKLYERVRGKNGFGQFFKAKSAVEAIYLSGGFEILAPWGEMERAPSGYLLLNGNEVYGNNAGTFEATYEILGQ